MSEYCIDIRWLYTDDGTEKKLQFKRFNSATWEDVECVHDVETDTPIADATTARTARELRAEGKPFCPKCYTFGHEHSRNCAYRFGGMNHHVSRSR